MIAEQYMWSHNMKLTVHVAAPPDLRHAENRRKAIQLARQLESIPGYSVGDKSTKFFLLHYLRYLSDFFDRDLDKDFYNQVYMAAFLELPANKHFQSNTLLVHIPNFLAISPPKI